MIRLRVHRCAVLRAHALFFCATVMGLGASSFAMAAEEVGHVLVATGNVAALRAGVLVPLPAGTAIQVGDEVRTGPASNAQLRFSDSAIVALKPETSFVVTDYSFHGKEDGSERAIFGLLRGGLRTVTGLIGHLNNRNYEVRMPTATIGIRGTMWGAHVCVADECKLADGSTAKPGTYGEVRSGLIAVTNNTPEVDYGPNTIFYVADKNTPPARILALPEFVVDKLESRAATVAPIGTAPGGAAGGGAAGGGAAGAASPAQAQALDPSTVAVADITAPTVFVASNNRTSSGASTALPAVNAVAPVTGVAGFVAAYAPSNGSFDDLSSCDNCGTNNTGASTFEFKGESLISYASVTPQVSTLKAGGTVTVLEAMPINNGSQIFIGQITGAYSGYTTLGYSYSGPGAFLYAGTDSPVVNQGNNLPTTGTFQFGYPGSFVGAAVDSAGNSATSTRFSGAFNANTGSVSFSAQANFNTVAGYGAAAFTFGGSGTVQSGSDHVADQTLSWFCSGGGCQGASGAGTWSGRFILGAGVLPAQVIDGALYGATRFGRSGSTVVFISGLRCVSGAC